MRAAHSLALAVLTLAGSGCHKKRQSGPAPFETMCERGCARVNECDPEVNREDCRVACLGSFGPIGEHLRPEYVEELQQCITDARCIDLGVSALDNSCRHDASDRIGANLKVIKLCDGLSETLSRCTVGVPAMRLDACLETMKVFDDDTVEDATDCNDSECRDLGKCFTTILGFVPSHAMSASSTTRE
jgi:hypothetical protein